MHAESEPDGKRVDNPLVHYYRECLAVQMEWARAVNVLEQKDVLLVPLTSREQTRLGSESSLELSRPDAVELANRYMAGGSETSLMLGALFLVGRTPGSGDRPERRYCAPLLECPLKLRREMADGVVRLEPEEEEFSLNYSLIGELFGADEDDLQDRLAELAELVPDFPIDEGEFDDFWNGFQMVATDLAVADVPPPRSRSAKQTSESVGGVVEDDGQQPGNLIQSEPVRATGLEIVDFYLPQIPKDGRFYLLPATAIVMGRRAGHPLSALRELESMAEMALEKTAFSSVFGSGTVERQETYLTGDVILEDALPLPLTRTQEAIVRSARNSSLTVVTGPPGTGKSYTITSIVLDALLHGQSVLVASQMDKAVQVVADSVETIAGQFSIVRSGGRAAQRRLAKQISQLTGPRRKLTSPSASEFRRARSAFRDLAKRLERLEQRYEDIVSRERMWSENWQSFQRLQPTSSLPVHDVNKRSLRKAKRFTERARRGREEGAGWVRRAWGAWNKSRALRMLQVPDDWECSLGEMDELLRVQALQHEFVDAALKLRTPFPANLVWREIADVQQRMSDDALKVLGITREQHLSKLLANQDHRAQLRTLATMLRRRRHDLKRKLREKIDPAVVLSAFPAWASTMRTLGEILPATPGLFDLVIIDEASQCDPALAAVALLRGKRAVVVGDPQQLRHVCFLSRAREQAAFARYGLSEEMQQRYRYRRSLFDIASDNVEQEQFFLLDQHFRSHPHIIDFSNRSFYDADLRIMTRRPSRDTQSAIRVVRTSGRRDSASSVNRGEVDCVARVVAEIIQQTESQPSVPSIGVVSPFRDHVDAVRDRLINTLPGTVLERYGIVVGTAHALQGDEKDIVLFTTSIDPDSHSASLRFLETPNLFNVAITRARKKVIVITSVGVEDLPSGLLREYLHHAAGSWQTAADQDEEAEEGFERQVVERIRQQPIEVWPAFRAAGVRVPLVVRDGDRYAAVLCDGFPVTSGDDLDALTMHRILARAGWPVVRIPHRSWQADWFGCYEEMARYVR